MTAPLPVDDAAPTAGLSAPATADRGTAITLTAAAGDDFGVKRVRFADGGTTLGTVTAPPYTLAATIPADAACGSTRTYTAVVIDSAGQTKSASATVTVTCPAPNPNPNPPAPPTIAFAQAPSTLSGTTRVRFTPVAAAGLKQVELFLGSRRICTLDRGAVRRLRRHRHRRRRRHPGAARGRHRRSSAPPPGDRQRRASPSSRRRSRSRSRSATSPAARRAGPSAARVSVPRNVTRAQACSGTVTVAIKRAGRSVLNQRVKLSKSCTFSRSVTAARGNQSFSVSAKFGGNAVLRTASQTRRFS